MMEKQKELCERKGWPFFAPSNGKCWGCGKEVPDNGEKLITGCPHCNRTYCD